MVTNRPSETFNPAIFPPKERGLGVFWTPETAGIFSSACIASHLEALSVEKEDFTLCSTCPCPSWPPCRGVSLVGPIQGLCGGNHVNLSQSWTIQSSFPAEPSVCLAVPVSGFSLLHTFNHSSHSAGFICLKAHLTGPLSCPTWTGRPPNAVNGFRALFPGSKAFLFLLYSFLLVGYTLRRLPEKVCFRHTFLWDPTCLKLAFSTLTCPW